MSKITLIILMALVSLVFGAAVKKDEMETKKDKRGLLNLGYGFGYTPDYTAHSSQEYVLPVPLSYHPVTVQKHFQVPAPISVYDPYRIEVTKPVPVAQSIYPLPVAVNAPDTIVHLPYAKRYSYGIANPIFIDKYWH